jgi:hypothetical protein
LLTVGLIVALIVLGGLLWDRRRPEPATAVPAQRTRVLWLRSGDRSPLELRSLG